MHVDVVVISLGGIGTHHHIITREKTIHSKIARHSRGCQRSTELAAYRPNNTFVNPSPISPISAVILNN